MHTAAALTIPRGPCDEHTPTPASPLLVERLTLRREEVLHLSLESMCDALWQRQQHIVPWHELGWLQVGRPRRPAGRHSPDRPIGPVRSCSGHCEEGEAGPSPRMQTLTAVCLALQRETSTSSIYEEIGHRDPPVVTCRAPMGRRPQFPRVEQVNNVTVGCSTTSRHSTRVPGILAPLTSLFALISS